MTQQTKHIGRFFEVLAVTRDTESNEKKRQTYIVEASTFSEAEDLACSDLPVESREDDIRTIRRANFVEVYTSERGADDRYFRCKVKMVTVNDNNGREQTTTLRYLINADTTNTAQHYLDKLMHPVRHIINRRDPHHRLHIQINQKKYNYGRTTQ